MGLMGLMVVKIWYIDGDKLECFSTLIDGVDYNTEEEIREVARDFWHDFKFDVKHPIHKIQVLDY